MSQDRGRVDSAWRRALVYFGLAEGSATPGAHGPRAVASLPDVVRRLDEQEAQIAELRAEVERLRARERGGLY